MLLALLVVTRAAAEWVEISQQHYQKPVRLTTALDENTKNTFQNVHPTKNTYLSHEVLQTPSRDSFFDQNAQNPMINKYHDVPPARNTQLSHHVFLPKPVRDDFLSHEENPTRKAYFDKDVKPVRIDPFLQDNVTLQSAIKNTYFSQDVLQSPTRDTYFNEKLESTKKETYPNHSIAEHHWSQNMHRPGNGRGDAKVSTTVPSHDNWNENTYRPNNERSDKPDERRKHNVEENVPNIVRIKDETVSGKIERVPNIGSVKRVQLANTPVKSPALNKGPGNTPNRRNNIHTYEANNYDSFSDELDTHEHAGFRKPSNHFNIDVISNTENVQITPVDGKTRVPNEETKSHLANLQRHSITRKPDVTDEVTDVIEGISKLKQNSEPENMESTNEQKVVNKISTTNRLAKPKEEYTTNEFTKVIPDLNTKKDVKVSPKEEVKINIQKDESPTKHRGSVNFENIHKVDEKESSPENGEIINSSSGEIKVNTMENILKFMKVVADTISKNTRRGASGKITYLNELKHTLLTNISKYFLLFPYITDF